MHEDPVQYWQALTENYRQMSDGELLELAEKPDDLTETARQVLRDELRMRRLNEAPARAEAAKIGSGPAAAHWESPGYRHSGSEEGDAGEVAHEYTWKTLLCECETTQQAWQLGETLRRAGIESWIQAPRSSGALDLVYPRVTVAADELERAQAIAAMPIPPDIVEEALALAAGPQHFTMPECPTCGAADPVLCEVEEPATGDGTAGDGWVNVWQCEACGAEWADEVK